MHRRAEESTDIQAGLGKKLLNVNKWVRAEAAQQQENLAAGKTKDGKEKGKMPDGSIPAYSWTGSGGTAGGNPDFHSGSAPRNASADEVEDELIVECSECG